MKKSIFLFSLFIFSFSLSYGQSWLWGEQGIDIIKATSLVNWVTTDKNGNAYITGQYHTNVIFGKDTLEGPWSSPYLVKYDSSGNVIWARQPQTKGTFTDFNQGFSDDMDRAGNIYMVGIFTDTLLFGPYTLYGSTSYNSDLFITKYSPGGNVIWAKHSAHNGNGSIDKQCVVASDSASNAYVTGTFSDSVIFDNDTLMTTGHSNVFLVKYDANGNLIWAKQSNGIGYNSAASVTTDNVGNIYITGSFSGTIEFDKDTLVNGGTFLVKYDTNGHVIWASESDSIGTAQAIVTDNSGNIYVAGYAFYPSNISLTKYNNMGKLLWGKYSRSNDYWKATSLSADKNNHIYLAGVGVSADTLYFDNKYYTWDYTPLNFPAFLLKLDTAGNPLCGTILPGGRDITGPEWVSCASDSSGKYIYLAGSFFDSLICGPDTLDFSNDEAEPYIARWNVCNELLEGISPILSPTYSICIFPNPNNGVFNLEISHPELVSGTQTIEVYNMLGEKVYSQLNSKSPTFNVDLGSQPNGIYLYRVLQQDGSLIGDGKVIIRK